MKRYIEILTVLDKYHSKNDQYDLNAQHDTIYFSPNIKKNMISSADLERLKKLHVLWHKEYECFYVYT